MASTIPSTYGAWLLAVWLATILYGAGVVQAWLYFHWYPNDHWGVRSTVTVLIVCETLHISFLFGATYNALINDFGDPLALFTITWMDSAQLLAGYLSAFIVQTYYAWSIYLLNKKQKTVTVLIMVLAFAQIGAGLAQTIDTTILGSLLKLDKTKPTMTFQSAATLACDTVITLALYLSLRSRRTGMEKTNTLLQKLMINAVNRGALTALAAAVTMILFLALPGKLYFLLGLMTSGKLYMNSMLATLNSRQHLMKTSADSERAWNSIQLGGLSTVPHGTGIPTTQTASHSDDTELNEIMKPNSQELHNQLGHVEVLITQSSHIHT
ncbi:hypothetical protein BDP27DRAFT_1337227 [Rhodocollybia butyracea]|uniref:DUF6534 domain-containing protein n=1 Tax=Rhodocollybia butyracea TaxID=206335 RepID=A0A9P5PG15_9AGAR|nr:hypothetical protein BDP27DRAFT_1337227 [Rhodocollybia butyracea]